MGKQKAKSRSATTFKKKKRRSTKKSKFTSTRIKKGSTKRVFRKRKQSRTKRTGGKSTGPSKIKSLLKAVHAKDLTILLDLNVQSGANAKGWLFDLPALTPALIQNQIIPEYQAAVARQVTVGTKPSLVPQRILIKKARYMYRMKSNNANPVEVIVHTFKVRRDVPNNTTSGYNTSTPAQIWTDGAAVPTQIDSSTSSSLNTSFLNYEWWHNKWFCSWFKHVSQKKYVLRPQDGAKRIFHRNDVPKGGKMYNPRELINGYTLMKGTHFHALEYRGEMCGDGSSAAWTGTAQSQLGGPGETSIHLLYEMQAQYSCLDRMIDLPTVDIVDSRNLTLSSTHTNHVPAATSILGPSWNGTNVVVAQATMGGTFVNNEII